MKSKGNNPKRSRMKLFILGLIVLSVGLAAWGGYTFYKNTSLNYAKEVAKPIEEALVKAGGVKRCENGDSGRGWDNRSPWYNAIFELPGKQSQNISTMKDIASGSGYKLVDASQGINVEDRIYLGDNISKKHTYSALQPGNIDLNVTIYARQVFKENSRFCGVTKRDSPPKDKTTLDINVSLPEYRK